MRNGIHKILLLRFSSLGDILMTTAMVRAVRKRFPVAQVDMAVREDFVDLIARNPHLDGKIALPRSAGTAGLIHLLRRLNREHYDLVYDAHRSLRTRFLLPLLQAEKKVCFDKHYVARSAALLFKYPRLKDRSRMLERFCLPLEPLGVKYDGGGPELVVDPQAREKVEGMLPPAAQRVGILASAQWPGKRWPAERFREVIEARLRDSNEQVLLFGGREDTFCADIAKGLPESRVVNLQGKLSLQESLAGVSLCGYVVANDTGLMHAADALGIPSILILGPTSAELGCLPFHPESRILEHDLWCRPCSKNGQAPCIRSRRFCLDLTEASHVSKAAAELAEPGP